MSYYQKLYETPIIETPRLILRRYLKEDAADIVAMWSEKDMGAYTIFQGVHTIEDAVNSIFNHFTPNPGFYAIADKSSGKFMGSIDIMLRQGDKKAEFAYALSKEYWGKGYMTEALQALMTLCFDELDLNRVEARHLDGNVGSGKAMEKAGMKLEGIGKEELFLRDKFWDIYRYAVTKADWKHNHGM